MAIEILLIIGAFILVLAGGIGVILPFLPGVPVAWLGILLFAYATHFEKISLLGVVIFLIATAATFLLDIAAPLLGARQHRASIWGMLGAVVGVCIGLLVLGPVGIVAGPLLGAFAGEIIAGRKTGEAASVAQGAVFGMLVGTALKLALVAIMLGYLIWALL